MLSIKDIYREIGRNIYICPLKTENIRDNSIDLTASKFAWTLDRKNAYDETTDLIIIPAQDPVCILTEESVFVTGRIGGTFHSRVSLVAKGLGHLGTMLDPLYCGQSLITLQNMTKQTISIKRGERIASIVFHYLKTPINEGVLPNPPSHIDKIAALDSEGRYQLWLNENLWVNNPKMLKSRFYEHYASVLKAAKRSRAKRRFF